MDELKKAPKCSSIVLDLKRKEDYSRKGCVFISDERFEQLTIRARKLGAVIIRGTEEVEKHLEFNHAAAATINDVIFFRKDVTISEVLEGTYHFEQNLKGMNRDKEEELMTCLNEIDAKRYLLRVAQQYRIPRSETETTLKQLREYEILLEELEAGKYV